MPEGLLGRKVGMTSVYRGGRQIPVTVLEVGPCPVVQVKRADGPDGYDALQLGFQAKKESRVNRPMKGHFSRAGVSATRVLREFRGMGGAEVGETLTVDKIFAEGDLVHVRGVSRGRGFAGVIKRHNFGGHKASHGTHESFRGPGSIGSSAYPARVWKGQRMPGQYGNKTITVRNLEIIEMIPDRNLVLVRGAVPGARNSVVELRKA